MCGVHSHQLYQPGFGNDIPINKDRMGNCISSFQPNNAVRRFHQAAAFFRFRMRGMVCSKHIHSAVCNGSQYSLPVCFGAQRRVHLGIGAVQFHCGIIQGTIMRSCFTGDAYPLSLGPADNIE